MDLTDLRLGFRDDDQRRRAGMVVHLHLADDRNQDECRYLLKLQWQLSVSYREVTWAQLRDHLGSKKLAAVEALIAALAESPAAVDRWIQKTEAAFPVVKDRGFRQWRRGRRATSRMWWLPSAVRAGRRLGYRLRLAWPNNGRKR